MVPPVGLHLVAGVDLREREVARFAECILKRAQRVVRDIDAQNLLLLAQLKVAVPLLAIRIGHADLETRALNVAKHIEERRLAARAVLLALYRGIDDVLGVVLVHKVHHLAAGIARGVEGACLDERFDHATVGLARVHALHKVV